MAAGRSGPCGGPGYQLEEIRQVFWMVHNSSPAGAYEMKEHIDYCFTCISEDPGHREPDPLILKTIYDFQVKEKFARYWKKQKA